MIAPGTGVRVYLACGVTDMRKVIHGNYSYEEQQPDQDLGTTLKPG